MGDVLHRLAMVMATLYFVIAAVGHRTRGDHLGAIECYGLAAVAFAFAVKSRSTVTINTEGRATLETSPEISVLRAPGEAE